MISNNRLLNETSSLLRKCNKNNKTSCKITLPISWLNMIVEVHLMQDKLAQDKEHTMPEIMKEEVAQVTKQHIYSTNNTDVVEKTICLEYNNGETNWQ